MNEKYDVIFSGQINITEDINTVKAKIQKAMKLSDAQLKDFFSGKKVFIKKLLPLKDAELLKTKIEQLGLMISLAPSVLPKTNVAPTLTIEKTQSTLKAAIQETKPKALPKIKEDDDDYYDTIDDQSLEGAIPPTFALNFDGRYGPMNFLNAQLHLICVLLPLGGLYFVLRTMNAPEVVMNAYKITMLVIYIAFSYRLVALRLQDLNKSHWLFVLFLTVKIPVVGVYIALLFALYLIFMPGSKEMNQYGTPTEQGSKLGIVAFFLLVPAFAGGSFYLGQQQNSRVGLVESGIALTHELQSAIQKHYADNKKLPTSLHELNMQIMSPDPTVIIGVELTDSNEIKINYSFKVKKEGYLTLAPVVTGEIVSWRCNQSNLDEAILPHPCDSELAKR